MGIMLIGQMGIAQVAQDSLALVEDGAPLPQRSFKEGLEQRYADKAFDYSEDIGESRNLLVEVLAWFLDKISNTLGIKLSPLTLKILVWIIYLGLGALVIYLLIRFFIHESPKSLFSRKASELPNVQLSETELEELDLEDMIAAATKEGNYRLAVRYQYLQSLKLLSQRGLIHWQYEKTNSDYRRELASAPMAASFAEICRLYEYVWYGEQPMDNLRYAHAQQRFKNLKQMIPA